jgi:lysozyme
MTLDRQQLRRDLIRDEGLRPRAYRDTVGKLTAGVGRNLEDVEFTAAEIDLMLETDIDRCVLDLVKFPWFPLLDPVRQRALVNMRFNLGPKGFRGFFGMIKAIEQGEYGRAAQHMLASKWAVQVGRRAVRLAEMMRDGPV